MAGTAATEVEIRALIEAVDQADQAGNRAEAERVLTRARAAAPDHPGVLNAAGMRALGAGDAAAARPLLERAAQLDPASPYLWVNVALAQRELRDETAERDALEKALAADPRYFPALLHKARLFERQGKLKSAAEMYHAFLCCLPPGAQPPPAVQAAIQRASEVMRKNDSALEAFLEPRLGQARARTAEERLDRFNACLQALLGRRRVFTPQPSFLLFPGLPAIEFIDREHYPWLDAFDAATDEIRAEARAVLAEAAGDFVPYVSMRAGTPVDQWRELNNSNRWSTYFLLKNGRPIEDHMARCPRTARLLASAPRWAQAYRNTTRATRPSGKGAECEKANVPRGCGRHRARDGVQRCGSDAEVQVCTDRRMAVASGPVPSRHRRRHQRTEDRRPARHGSGTKFHPPFRNQEVGPDSISGG